MALIHFIFPDSASDSDSPTFFHLKLEYIIMSPKEDGDILHHVLSMIFELDDTSPLVKILKSEGWDILSFITESHVAITTLHEADCNIPS